jgi:hypothetical protein
MVEMAPGISSVASITERVEFQSNQEKIIMTTTTNIATSASNNPVKELVTPTLSTTILRDAICTELPAKSSLEMGWIREIHLSLLTTPDELDAETDWEADGETNVLMFIAVDHAKPARFEPAVVKAEPGFDYTNAFSRSAVIRSDSRGFEFTFYIDQPCEHVTSLFIYAEPQFGILERAGQLFVGVRLGDLQAFAALTVNGSTQLSMETSAGGNGIMLELVDSRTGERMYPRFVLLPRKFMTALRRAIARQFVEPSQMPLQLQLVTQYSVFFNSNQTTAECWAAARHLSVGKDCPVQRLWIHAYDNFSITEIPDDKLVTRHSDMPL